MIQNIFIKQNDKYKKLKVFFAFFLGIILYNFIVVNNFSFFKVDEITYTYHIVDFSIGLCTKLLPGAIFSFLFKDVMPWQATLIETLLLFLVFAIVSHFIAELICNQSDLESTKAMLVLSLFIVTGPVTFSVFTTELGMLDVYWIYFSLLFFLFISKKYLYIFIPAVFILSVFIHFSSLTSYVLMFSVIILYRIAKEKSGRILLIFILFISVFASLIVMAFLMKNESENILLDYNDFHSFLDSRFKMDGDTYYKYYDYALYRVPYVESYPYDNMANDLLIRNVGNIPAAIVGIINALWQQFNMTLYAHKETPTILKHLIHAIALTLPVYIFFFKFWIFKIREEFINNKPAAFSYFLMLVQFPVTAIMGCLCSPDVVRWLSHAFIIQIAFLLYVVFTEKEKAIKWISDYILKYDKKALLIYWGVYAITFFVVYD